MRVKFRRAAFVGGNYYDTDPAGHILPDHLVDRKGEPIPLPEGATIWNGKEFVDPPEKLEDMKKIGKQGKTSAPDNNPDAPVPPPPVFNPAYKTPARPEAEVPAKVK